MRRALIIISVIASVLALAVPANAGAPGHVIVAFDESQGENPEGLTIDKRGTIFMSFPFLGEVRALAPDGSQRLYATLPSENGFGPLGLAVDAPGNVYAGVVTFNPASQGVYKISRDGSFVRLPGSEGIAFANGVAVDNDGTVYVADSIGGQVWRIPPGGSAEVWLHDTTLEGDGSFPTPFPVGANGVAIRQNTVYVTNTEKASLVAIPIRPDGAAGTPHVLAQEPALYGADGIALDVHGGIWIPVVAQSTIVRVSRDGSVTPFATANDGLDAASSIAFGTGRGERKTLFAVNFSVTELFGGPPGFGPALLSFDAGVPGDPLP